MIGCDLFQGHISRHAHIFHKQEATRVFRNDGTTFGMSKQGLDREAGMEARGSGVSITSPFKRISRLDAPTRISNSPGSVDQAFLTVSKYQKASRSRVN